MAVRRIWVYGFADIEVFTFLKPEIKLLEFYIWACGESSNEWENGIKRDSKIVEVQKCNIERKWEDGLGDIGILWRR